MRIFKKTIKSNNSKEWAERFAEIIQERANENGKDVFDTSLDDIIDVLNEYRNKKMLRPFFKYKISTIKKFQKRASGTSDIANFLIAPFVLITKKITSALIGKKVKQKTMYYTGLKAVDLIAQKVYKDRK